jgi:hypothetical protein
MNTVIKPTWRLAETAIDLVLNGLCVRCES